MAQSAASDVAVKKSLPVFNNTADVIPPFGAVGVQGIDDGGNIIVGFPTATAETELLFNGVAAINPGEYGQAK